MNNSRRINSSSSVGSLSRSWLRVFMPRCMRLARASSARRSGMSSCRACLPHLSTADRKDRSAAMVTPPAPSSWRQSIKSRSTTALRFASFTLPSSRLSMASVASFVLPGSLVLLSLYLSIRSPKVAPLGTGAYPPAAMWFACASIWVAQSLASRLVAKVAARYMPALRIWARHLPDGN